MTAFPARISGKSDIQNISASLFMGLRAFLQHTGTQSLTSCIYTNIVGLLTVNRLQGSGVTRTQEVKEDEQQREGTHLALESLLGCRSIHLARG